MTEIRVFEGKQDLPFFGAKAGDTFALHEGILFHQNIREIQIPLLAIVNFQDYFTEVHISFISTDEITSIAFR